MLRKFHEAAQKPGILISTCTLSSSGCQDFGKALAAEYKLTQLRFTCDKGSKGVTFACVDSDIILEIAQAPSKYEKTFITGCNLDVAPVIALRLIDDLKLTSVTDLYVVIAPHQSKVFFEQFSIIFNKFKAQVQGKYQVSVLTSGVDCNSDHAIGLPKPYPILESKYEMNESCYGLMYNNHHPSWLQSLDNVSNYLLTYFLQVRLAAKNSKSKDATVFAIGINQYLHGFLEQLAGGLKLKIKFLEKLPQADFIQAIKAIAAKGGVIAMDGAQTMMQALSLGAKIFFYDTDGNHGFCEQLVESLSSEHRAIASVILGLSDQYGLLKDQQKVALVYKSLQDLINTSVKKFEDDKKKYARVSISKQANIKKTTESKYSDSTVKFSTSSATSLLQESSLSSQEASSLITSSSSSVVSRLETTTMASIAEVSSVVVSSSRASLFHFHENPEALNDSSFSSTSDVSYSSCKKRK